MIRLCYNSVLEVSTVCILSNTRNYALNFVDIFTHRRSVAKRDGCFQRCLFVCQFVSLSVCLSA